MDRPGSGTSAAMTFDRSPMGWNVGGTSASPYWSTGSSTPLMAPFMYAVISVSSSSVRAMRA